MRSPRELSNSLDAIFHIIGVGYLSERELTQFFERVTYHFAKSGVCLSKFISLLEKHDNRGRAVIKDGPEAFFTLL